MKQKNQSSLEKEGFLLLLEGSLSSILFNIVLALLLGIDFFYNQVPLLLIGIWFSVVLLLSVGRWLNSLFTIKNKSYITNPKTSLIRFLTLTFLMGLTWGSSYFIFLPYINPMHETIFMLILGGMSAGAIASLSIYLPAYYAYVSPMILPIIIYNFYLFQVDRSVLATIYLLFMVMVFLTARTSSHLLYIALRLGREKDVLINELTLMNLKLEKSVEEVRTMSITDSLTGLFNRRYFDMIFSNELGRAKRDKYPISLVFIDIDNFKYINDTFGHPTGDEFLIYVANSLKESLKRANDMLFRLGGDEFAAILANMPVDDVVNFCALIQDLFNKKNRYKNVTLSMGIICISSIKTVDQQSIVTAADKILYQAKQAGKNQIRTHLFN